MINKCDSLLYIAIMAGIVISSCSMKDMEAGEGQPDFPPSGFVMKFEREGGYLGWHDGFWIYPDGRVFSSTGKTARIPPGLVVRWMEMVSPAAAPILKETSSLQSMSMDCYRYRITVYDKAEPEMLSLHCTDTYPLGKGEGNSTMSVGTIRDTLMSLSWE